MEVKTIFVDMEKWAGPAIKQGSVGSKSPQEGTERVYSTLRAEFDTPGNSCHCDGE